MKKITTFNYFKLYDFILGMCMAIFILFFFTFLVKSFYNFMPEKINVPKFINITGGVDQIKLRQERVFDGKGYMDKNELLVSNIDLKGTLFANEELPVTILTKDKKSIKAKYFPLTKTILLTVNNNQVDQLKRWLGLIKCFYIFLVILGIWQVRKMLLSVKNNSYFEQKNAQRLQFAGTLFFVIPICSRFFNKMMEYYLLKTFNITEFSFIHNYDFSIQLWLVAGVVAIVLAFVIKKGIELKQESDLTI